MFASFKISVPDSSALPQEWRTTGTAMGLTGFYAVAPELLGVVKRGVGALE
jgi:hypothetical protein